MQGRKRPMPVGIEDFGTLVRGEYCFVDKTRFIRELLDTRTAVTLITRPRRFGKTLALSMLQYFFTMEDAEENRKLFRGLEIERAGEQYMREQGSRPVVFLTLKEIQAGEKALFLKLLARILQRTFQCHAYLLSGDGMTAESRQTFQRLLELRGDEADLRLSLHSLMQWLEDYHGRKPVLLLDEYDAPILSAWENGYYKEGIEFMRGFLGSALKTNPALGFAVLTGVTRVSKESIFSGLNNLKVCSVLSDAYCDIFGFTQEEAARLMEECGAADKIPELKRWYDGYRFGRAEIYNPWSVIRYIDEGCKFRPYWLNTSGNSILKVLLEHVDGRRQEELEGLLQGKPVKAPILENIVYADIHSSRNALFMMLLTAGYLKAVDIWQDATDMEWASLQIPNREIRRAFRDEIVGNIVPRQGAILCLDLLDAMASGNAGGFARYLSELLRDFVSYHDAAQPESFYHGLVLGFAVLMEGEYRVESNRESSYGRFDIAFFPLKPGTPGVILELKSASSEGGMEEKAREALRQIEEKSYAAELSRQGARNVWKYGIAFHGKKVWVEGGTMQT